MWIVYIILSIVFLFLNCVLTSRNSKYAPLAMTGSLSFVALVCYAEYLHIFRAIYGGDFAMGRLGAMRFIIPMYVVLMIACNIIVMFIMSQEKNPATNYLPLLVKKEETEQKEVKDEEDHAKEELN